MAQQLRKEKGAIAAEFRAAWSAGRFDEASELLYVLANDLMDGNERLSEERAAKLTLKPTKTLKQFLALCDEETLRIFMHSPLGLARTQPTCTLALNMSRLLASSAHFPKLAEALVRCGAREFLAEFMGTLPGVVHRASQPPFDATLMVAGNFILTVILLNRSQEGFDDQLLRSRALEALSDCIPFPEFRPPFSTPGSSIPSHTLYFVSAALHLCIDLTHAKRVHEGEGADLGAKIVAWGVALLDLVSEILEAQGDEEAQELGNLPQTSTDNILGLLHMVGKGFPGMFDFQPSIRRARPLLQRFNSGDRAQVLSYVEGLERTSKQTAAGEESDAAQQHIFLIMSPLRRDFLDFHSIRDAFLSSSLEAQIRAMTELATFFCQRKVNPSYRQANLHERRSLLPLAPLILDLLEARSPSDLKRARNLLATTLDVLFEIAKTEAVRLSELPEKPSLSQTEQLEEVGVRLLTWLESRHSALRGRALVFMALGVIGQCVRHATWSSLAALLEKHGFLRFCKTWFEADSRSVTFEETEDFALRILAPLRVPRGCRILAYQIAIRDALTHDRMLAWVFERAARSSGFSMDKRPNLLPLLALCSKINVNVSAFLTPEVLRLFVRQLVRNWGGCRGATLPTFEKENVVTRSMGDEVDRLAGHVRIVEAALCSGRRDTGGNWDPGYLAELSAAISDGAPRPEVANFMTFCEAEGVAVFASIVKERKRLERFRLWADTEGYLLPEAADVAERVGAVWELVAAALGLHPCADQACSRVEAQKGTFMKCGRCKIARYCGQACQKNHWKAGHKQHCRV